MSFTSVSAGVPIAQTPITSFFAWFELVWDPSVPFASSWLQVRKNSQLYVSSSVLSYLGNLLDQYIPRDQIATASVLDAEWFLNREFDIALNRKYINISTPQKLLWEKVGFGKDVAKDRWEEIQRVPSLASQLVKQVEEIKTLETESPVKTYGRAKVTLNGVPIGSFSEIRGKLPNGDMLDGTTMHITRACYGGCGRTIQVAACADTHLCPQCKGDPLDESLY